MYTAEHHTRLGWRNFLDEVKTSGEPREVSETVYEYLCDGGAGPHYREIDGVHVKIWRSSDHRYYVRRTR